MTSQQIISDGSLIGWTLSIEFFSRSEITLTFDGVPIAPGVGVWNWVGSTGSTIAFTPAVAPGVAVAATRVTESDAVRHVFEDGAQFRADVLDENFTQLLRLAQEYQALTGVVPVGLFDSRYIGARSTNPTVDNSGNALVPGSLYYNTVNSELRTYDGTTWRSGSASTLRAKLFSGTGAQVNFVLDDLPVSENNTQVYVNGVYQQKDTYSLVASTLVFSEAPPVGVDNIEVVTVSTIPLSTSTADFTEYTPTSGVPETTVQPILARFGAWILAAASSAGTAAIGFVQAGVGAILRTVQDELRETVKVTQFGASPTKTAAQNDVAFNDAITYCKANGKGLGIPSGTYQLTSGAVNFAGQGLTIKGAGSAVLQFTGTGRGFVLDTTAAIGIVIGEMVVENLVIVGGPAITDGFYSRGIVRSAFSNIEVRECTTSAFTFLHGVSNYCENLKYSTNVIAQTTKPATGLILDKNGAGYYTADCTFVNTIMEGFPGKACNLIDAQGNKFVGGTLEAVAVGLEVSAVCIRNSFDSVWFEANTTRDIEIYGKATEFNNCYLGSNGVPGANAAIVTGKGTMFRGGFVRAADMQATSRDTHFDSVGLSDNGALGFTGSGVFTRVACTKIDVSANISGYFNDIIGPAQSLIFAAAQVPSSGANTLDDYEEGAWTPVLTSAGGTITPNATFTGGRYTKVGNLVTVNGCVYVSSVAAPTGALTITGLPFVSKSGTTEYRAGSVYATDLNTTATQPIMAGLQPASTVLVLGKLVSGVASAMAADIKAGSDIRFSITYQNDEV